LEFAAAAGTRVALVGQAQTGTQTGAQQAVVTAAGKFLFLAFYGNLKHA
jgi:hypothetical protein